MCLALLQLCLCELWLLCQIVIWATWPNLKCLKGTWTRSWWFHKVIYILKSVPPLFIWKPWKYKLLTRTIFTNDLSVKLAHRSHRLQAVHKKRQDWRRSISLAPSLANYHNNNNNNNWMERGGFWTNKGWDMIFSHKNFVCWLIGHPHVWYLVSYQE